MIIKEYTKDHLLLCATPPTNTSYDVSYCINMDADGDHLWFQGR